MHAARTPPDPRIAALALMAGARVALALPAPLPVALAGAFVVIGAACALRAPRWRLAALLALAFGLASAHAGYALDARIASTPAKHDDALVGRVTSLPRAEPRRLVFDVQVDSARDPVLVGRTVRIAWYHEADVGPPR